MAEAVASLDEAAITLALTSAWTGPWYEISEVLDEVGSAEALLRGQILSYDSRLDALAQQAHGLLSLDDVDHWRGVVAQALDEPDSRIITVTDQDYPTNLRRIYNRPPFLFVRGSLEPQDERSIAVVGTRQVSPAGIEQASHLATELAARGVTVISGMAAGVDTCAHRAALEAGGRTIAVMGTGIDKVYPAANRDLSRAIVEQGALISQFWPGSPPRGTNFPLRNVVTSGMAVGTVVIEASSTSGAKMQARLALEHGKRLFLIRSLVLHEEWARRYAERRGAAVVESVDDVLAVLDAEQRPADQLALF